MVFLPENLRIIFWEDYGVAYDGHLNIVARVDRRDSDAYIIKRYTNNRDGHWPLMLKTTRQLTPLQDSVQQDYPLLWELDYPIPTSYGLMCNDTDNLLGQSVCVARTAPLGRAFVKLQRRIRFRHKARATLKRMISQAKAFDETIIDIICSRLMVVSIYPRVV